MRITTKAKLLTEKGKVVAKVRDSLQKKVEVNRDLFLKADMVAKGVYEVPVVNNDNEVKFASQEKVSNTFGDFINLDDYK